MGKQAILELMSQYLENGKRYVQSYYTVSHKNKQNYFCYNYVKLL